MMLRECACIVAVVVCVAGMRQTTASVMQVQWRLPRHWGAGSARWKASISTVSLCVLPHAVLGSAPFVPCFLRSVACVRAGRRACAALWDAERVRVSCCCFLMCGMDATGNRIGDAGAVAIAKALESGQCKLKSLDLSGESA